MTETTKICKTCGETKAADRYDSGRNTCKPCRVAQTRKRRADKRAGVVPPPKPPITHKTCRFCKIAKPLDELVPHKRCSAGHSAQCRTCFNAYERERYRRLDDAALDRLKLRQREKNRLRRALNPEKVNAAARAYRAKHPEQFKAQIATWQARYYGRLIVGNCERCGTSENIHCHHDDYSKRLDVRFLCAACHGREHRAINRQRRSAQQPAP